MVIANSVSCGIFPILRLIRDYLPAYNDNLQTLINAVEDFRRIPIADSYSFIDIICKIMANKA